MESPVDAINFTLGAPTSVDTYEPKTLDYIDPFQQRDQNNSGLQMAPVSSDPTAEYLSQLYKKGPSLETQMQPVTFDPEAAQLDRYTNSKYFSQLGFDPRKNNEYAYGSYQTWGDTMANALGGAGRLAANTFAEHWKGYGRLADALFSFDASKLQPDNMELYSMAKEQEAAMNKYAIFRTPESEDSVINKQFFGDMVQNAGFMLGTIGGFLAEELLTMGASSVFSATRLGIKVMQGLDRIQDVEEFVRVNKSLGDIWKSRDFSELMLKGAKRLVPLYETGEKLIAAKRAGAGALQMGYLGLGGLRRALSEANIARTESVFEAAGTYKEIKDALYNEYLENTGEQPSADALDRIETAAREGAMDNFKTNFGMLLITNRLQFDNLFSGLNLERKLLSKAGQYADDVFAVTGKLAGSEAAEEAAKTATKVYSKGAFGTFSALGEVAADFGRKEAAWVATKALGRNMFKWEASEGLQELFQEGSNKGLTDYYYQLYHGKRAYGSRLDAIMENIETPFDSTQGAKTFLMGALTGRLLSPINFAMGKAREMASTTKEQREEIEADRDKSVAAMNAFYAQPYATLKEQIANFKVQNRAAENMQKAVANDDAYAFTNAKDSAFVSAMSAAKKLGMLPSFVDTIRAYGENMTNEELKEAFGFDPTEEGRGTAKTYFEKLATEVEDFNKTWERLDMKYGNKIRLDLYAPGSVGQVQAQFAKKALDHYIEMLATTSYRAQRAVLRTVSVADQMKNNPNIGASAAVAVRVMGSLNNLQREKEVLANEIDGLNSQDKLSPADRKRLKAKERQLQSLAEWESMWERLTDDNQEQYTKRELREAKNAYRKYINSKNNELEMDITISNADVDETYNLLLDYIQLNKDNSEFVNAYNFLADPEKSMAFFTRMQRAHQAAHQQLRAEGLQGVLEADIKEPDAADASSAKLGDLTEASTPVSTEAPEATEPFNEQNFINELTEAYREVVTERLKSSGEFFLPKYFLLYTKAAKDILRKYGVKESDVEFDGPNKVTLDNINEVTFGYIGPKTDQSTTAAEEVSTGSVFDAAVDPDEPVTDQPTTDATFTPTTPFGTPTGEQMQTSTESTQEEPVQDTESDALQNQESTASDEEQQPVEEPETAEEETPTEEPPVEETAAVEETPEQDTLPTFEIEGRTFKVSDYLVDDINPPLVITGFDGDNVYLSNVAGEAIRVPKVQFMNRVTNGFTRVVPNADGAKLAATQAQPGPEQTQVDEEQVPQYESTQFLTNQSYTFEDKEGRTIPAGTQTVDSMKVNNRSDNMETVEDKDGFLMKRRTTPNEKYPMVMATPKINAGTSLTLEIDTEIEDYDEYDYISGGVVTKRTKADFFNADGSIKPEAVSNFPIAIYSVVDGKKIKLGYLPTEQWVSAKDDNGNPINIVDVIYDRETDVLEYNYDKQVEKIKSVRKQLFDAHNSTPGVIFDAVVTTKTPGVLRTQGEYVKLNQVLTPSTKLAIVKRGQLFTSEQGVVDSDVAMPSTLREVTDELEISVRRKYEGLPIMLIDSPTGQKYANYVSVPRLAKEHQSMIVAAWKAFHVLVKNAEKKESHDKSGVDFQIVKAIYGVYGVDFNVKTAPAFEILNKYINDYISYTSSEQYNPADGRRRAVINITKDGAISLWSAITGNKKNDSVFMADINDVSQEKIDRFFELAANLYYNVKFETDDTAGINSDKKVRFLSVVDNQLQVSEPMTYNEHMMGILETNMEPGRPIEEGNPAAGMNYFANPVVNFELTGAISAPQTQAPAVQETQADATADQAEPASDLDSMLSNLSNMDFGQEPGTFDFDADLGEAPLQSAKTIVNDLTQDNKLSKDCK